MNTFMAGAFRVLAADLIPNDRKGRILSALSSRPISIRMQGATALGGGALTFASGASYSFSIYDSHFHFYVLDLIRGHGQWISVQNY